MLLATFAAQFPDIENQALDRLTQDHSLFDTKKHKLRDGITKERARAILMIASHIALGCGYRLQLTFDEQELMDKKFRK
jgi:hypothetical protein